MRWPSLTPKTHELLTAIWARPTTLDWLVGRPDRRVDLIAQTADSGEFAAIPSLLELLFDTSAPVAAAASDCIHRLLLTIHPQSFYTLDEELRSFSYWRVEEYFWTADKWRRLRPKDLPLLLRTASSRVSILGLASFHSNGHVREAAVETLESVDSGEEIPFLLLRLNDWVDNVRAAAKRAIRARMTHDRVDHFVRNIFLVARLVECGRHDHRDVIQWFAHQLIEPSRQQALRHLLESSERLVRRSCYQFVLDVDGPVSNEIVFAGLRSTDLYLRLRAAQAIRNGRLHGELDTALDPMTDDPFMTVRREALFTRVERQPEKHFSNS